MTLFLLLFGGGVLLTAGDIIFKYWTENQKPTLYASGFFFYTLGVVLLIETYKTKNIEAATAIFILTNIAALTVVGWLYFHERITVFEICGLAAAGVAVILLELGR